MASDPRLPIDLEDPAMRSALIQLGWQPPPDPGANWIPVPLGKGFWQGARYRKLPGGFEREFDSAFDPLDGPEGKRRAITFESELQCAIRCDELNRRRRIG